MIRVNVSRRITAIRLGGRSRARCPASRAAGGGRPPAPAVTRTWCPTPNRRRAGAALRRPGGSRRGSDGAASTGRPGRPCPPPARRFRRSGRSRREPLAPPSRAGTGLDPASGRPHHPPLLPSPSSHRLAAAGIPPPSGLGPSESWHPIPPRIEGARGHGRGRGGTLRRPRGEAPPVIAAGARIGPRAGRAALGPLSRGARLQGWRPAGPTGEIGTAGSAAPSAPR